jgi:hypothetical protein
MNLDLSTTKEKKKECPVRLHLTPNFCELKSPALPFSTSKVERLKITVHIMRSGARLHLLKS